MAEEKNGLDKFRDLYLPTVRKYEKKLADSLSYFAGPELTKLGQGIFALRPFQGSDLPIYDSNKSFGKNMLDMATGTGILGLDFATLGTASAPQKMAIKAAQEAAESGTKTGVRTVDEIIESGQVKKASEMTDDPLNVMSIKRDRIDSIREAKSDKFLKATKSDTPLNNALRNIGENKISQMTTTDLLKLLEESYGVKVGSQAISKKNLNIKPGVGAGSGNQFDQVKQAFETIDNPEQYSFNDLINLPQIKKVIEKNNISEEMFRKYKSKLGIVSPTNFFGKLDVNEDEVIKYITENRTITTSQLQKIFPKLQEMSGEVINTWRKKNKLSKINIPKTRGRKYVLGVDNPELSKQLDFVSQSGDKVLPSNIPIKHKDAFSEIITINKDGKPLDVKRTKIYQAHGIGEGGVTGASDQIIKSKVAMIPDKFLKDEKLPKFFLTKTGNDLHRVIEDNLVLALVNKYDKLGYNFVDGAWKQTKKVNPKSVNKELRSLQNEILGYQDELNKLDAYTLFYNPVKDKMVTHGKPLSEIPGLSNLLNQVKKGTNPYKKLKGGGLVGISHLTRPLGNF